ncbi:hypothetical protein JWH11_11015 [Xanthomonas melonis]|uniref:DUF3325 domain-containing protein n=1 Tax=Xanthomonas melonis TaxID=56456 RepID=A0ABS8NV51_9XANT|nr:hypothetical protein [Xanthomonas melonis]MCD0258615.1 hypothetical protein [Xanthomonas melonis]MCD0266954.1 hypothetical protein [Xanthomonas melonis]
MLLTWLYLLGAIAAATLFYLATAHQRLWRRATRAALPLRVAAGVSCALSLACGIAALGPWAGVFAAVTALMLAAIVLPCVDVWWQGRVQRRQVPHVG